MTHLVSIDSLEIEEFIDTKFILFDQLFHKLQTLKHVGLRRRVGCRRVGYRQAGFTPNKTAEQTEQNCGPFFIFVFSPKYGLLA
jgi:hypothetical protein